MKVAFCTLGCKVNQYDTEAMRALFEKAGHEVVNFDEKADVYIINTCTVTATGDKKSRQMVSRAHAAAPDAAIIVAGCYAQTAPDEAAMLPGVSAVAGTAERGDIVRFAENALGGIKKETVKEYHGKAEFESLDVAKEGRTRAYLKIQDGCDRYCTYCIIPYARGPVRSRSLDDIRRQLAMLEKNGFREVVLTGIHLMSYGKDTPEVSLEDVFAATLDYPGIERIRLGSLEPQLLSERFVKSISDNKKICRQFHLSLQSGSRTVLERMARRYTPDDYRKCVEALREAMPGCAVTTDIIVGFPGETDGEFRETIEFAREIGLAKIHVFPYSARRGTKAYEMPGKVSPEIKKKRTRELIAVGKQLESEYASGFLGKTEKVLFEEGKDGWYSGHTDTYLAVRVKSDTDIEGDISDVLVTGIRNGILDGKII